MDNKEKIVKFFSSEIKSVDVNTMTVDAVVSTKKTDRDGDIIMPEAFTKRLKVYKDHPVLLSSHFYHDLKSQIGEAVSTKVTPAGLEVKFKYYAGEGNDQADWAFNLAQKGIAAFSIGFLGMDYEYIKEKDPATQVERITGRKYTDVELLEISQVLVPSNRGALQMGRSAIAAESEIYELAAKAFGDGTLVDRKDPDPDPKPGDPPAAEPAETDPPAPAAEPETCGCEILDMIGITEVEGVSKCGACNKPIAADKVKAVKNFIKEVSGAHYSEAILPPGAVGSIRSAKDAAGAVAEAFKEINNNK